MTAVFSLSNFNRKSNNWQQAKRSRPPPPPPPPVVVVVVVVVVWSVKVYQYPISVRVTDYHQLTTSFSKKRMASEAEAKWPKVRMEL